MILLNNEVETYETLSKRIIDFEALWGNDEGTAYFFSFKLNEEDLRKRLLEFRESITVNILPDPMCVGDDDTKTGLENLLNKWNKRSISNREEINKILKEVRGYLVSIPIWLAAKYRNKDDPVLPVLNPNNLTYYGKYGFIEKI
jgi:hypothetical protein